MCLLGENCFTLSSNAENIRCSKSNIKQRRKNEWRFLWLDFQWWNRMENRSTWYSDIRWFVYSFNKIYRTNRSSTNEFFSIEVRFEDKLISFSCRVELSFDVRWFTVLNKWELFNRRIRRGRRVVMFCMKEHCLNMKWFDTWKVMRRHRSEIELTVSSLIFVFLFVFKG